MDQTSKPTNFDLFVLALSVFSLVNIVWLFVPLPEQIFRVVLIIDGICTVVFLTDFFLRLRRAPSKSSYFFGQQGWLDLVGSFPFPVLRLARIFRMFRTYRRLRHDGGRAVLRRMVADRAGSLLLAAVFLTILELQYASMAMLWAESENANANIRTASDAAWWAYVTITTVGYGDNYPVTDWGRLVGVLLLSTGVGLFAVITGFLANAFLSPRRTAAKDEAMRQDALDSRLRQLDELIERLRPMVSISNPLPDSDASPRSSPHRQETTL
ncbi:MAG: ion transporter [Thermomicrobiales bacterium]